MVPLHRPPWIDEDRINDETSGVASNPSSYVYIREASMAVRPWVRDSTAMRAPGWLDVFLTGCAFEWCTCCPYKPIVSNCTCCGMLCIVYAGCEQRDQIKHVLSQNHAKSLNGSHAIFGNAPFNSRSIQGSLWMMLRGLGLEGYSKSARAVSRPKVPPMPDRAEPKGNRIDFHWLEQPQPSPQKAPGRAKRTRACECDL
jgi:hypothetical protein